MATKRPIAVMYARAQEALVHADIVRTEEARREAQALLDAANQRAKKAFKTSERERLRVEFLRRDASAGDPIAEALLGELTLPELASAFETGDVEAFLSPTEVNFMIGRPADALRLVLWSRQSGEPLPTAGTRTSTPRRRSDYQLAARGRPSSADEAVIEKILDGHDS